jgi:hypothetical protein
MTKYNSLKIKDLLYNCLATCLLLQRKTMEQYSDANLTASAATGQMNQ